MEGARPRPRGDQMTDDDVFLKPMQRIELPLHCRSSEDLSRLLEGRGAQEAVRGQGRLGDPVDEGLALRALPQFSDKGDVADQKVNVGLRREGANEELRRLPVEDGIQNRLGDLLSRGRRVAGTTQIGRASYRERV